MSESANDAPKKVERNSYGLRELLFDEIDRLRAGKSSVGEARALAALVGQVINTVNMEMAIAKLRLEYPGDTKLEVPAPIKLERK